MVLPDETLPVEVEGPEVRGALARRGVEQQFGVQRVAFWPTRRFWREVTLVRGEWERRLFWNAPMGLLAVGAGIPAFYTIVRLVFGVQFGVRTQIVLFVAMVITFILRSLVKGVIEHRVRRELVTARSEALSVGRDVSVEPGAEPS